MNILFVIGPLKKGGAERVICNLSNELIKSNNVYIATTLTKESDYFLDKKVKVICLDDGKKHGFFCKNIMRIINLRKIIKENNIDIAISFLPEPSYRLILAKNNKLKTIISDRNDPNIEYNNFIKKMITKFLYSKADGFVFQTDDAQKWFSAKIQKRSIVIPNPINEIFMREPYKGKRKKIIVSVGRLTEQKNHKLLINAFSKIVKKHNDYVLKIYGNGELKESLDNYIKLNNLSNNVFLMGNVDNIGDEIYKASMFVLSSNYEGMPNALMEAMALGLPCISTNCPIGGPKFLIKNGENGFLTIVNDESDLENKMLKLLEDKELSTKFSENGHKSCINYMPNIINKKWKNYIADILNK